MKWILGLLFISNIAYGSTASEKKAENIYIGFDVADRGQSVSILSTTQYKALYGYVHDSRQYKDETYKAESLYFGFPLDLPFRGYLGAILSFESHNKSRYFNLYYAAIRPRFSLWKEVSPFNFGIQLDFGKGFSTLKSNDTKAFKQGYEPQIEALAGISVRLN